MREAQLTFTFDGEEGGGGKLFLLLLITLFESIVNVGSFPFRFFRKEKNEDSDDEDENSEAG